MKLKIKNKKIYITLGVLVLALLTCAAALAVNAARKSERSEFASETDGKTDSDTADSSYAYTDKPTQSGSMEAESSETQPATEQPTEKTEPSTEPPAETPTEPPTEPQETRSAYYDEQPATEQVEEPVYSEPTKYEQALAVAQSLAANISGANDLERVTNAAQIVAEYSSRATYTMSGDDYASAYGVFIKGEYSCAGSTRALIMLLECMGYSPRHINENLYTHQWVELTMDGEMGWADGQIGMADYGEYPFAVKETG